ncbi:MAG TPA: PEP-CTERM sorting domain-containing protein [Terriglobales bacterium]
MKIRSVLWLVAIIFVLSSVRIANADLTIFGSGIYHPENIAPVPQGFGSFGGGYLVNDPGLNGIGLGNIDYLPSTGGAATVFVTLPGGPSSPIGGLFLPSNFGAFGGQYLAVGFYNATGGNFAVAVAADGTVTPVASVPGYQFSDVVLAPAGFGSVAGKVLTTLAGGPIIAIDQNGNTSTFATVAGDAFGAAFAPQGFGSVGGDLLVSDAGTGNIFAVDANGNSILFATIPLSPNQFGLRQMAFAPAGFGSYGGDLFVSITGSVLGGGIYGAVVVLDASGNEVAILIAGSQAGPLDPRGLYFVDDQTLLIAATDPIFLATPEDFQAPTPEPATLLLFASGILGLGFRRFR